MSLDNNIVSPNILDSSLPSESAKPEKIKNTQDKAVDDLANMTHLGTKLYYAELVLKYCKKAFKYPQKFIKQLKIGESKGMFTRDLLAWMKTSNAVEMYILIAGSIFLTCRGLKPSNPDATLTSRIGNFGSLFLTESRKITESYGLLTSIQGIYQNPKSHIYPMIFAISMLSVSRFMPAVIKT